MNEDIRPTASADEVTIKFGKGLVGNTFTAKNGKEFTEIRIPNADPADKQPWEHFVVPAGLIHENQFTNGMYLKLPADRATTLRRSIREGVDEAGKPVWRDSSRIVSNTELKALMESYKSKEQPSVLTDLAEKKTQVAPPSPAKGEDFEPELPF